MFSPLQGCWRDGGGYIWESPGAGTALCQMEECALRLTLLFVCAGFASNLVLPQRRAARSHPGPGRKATTPRESVGGGAAGPAVLAGGGAELCILVLVGHGAIRGVQWGERCPLCGHRLSGTPVSLPPFAPPHPAPSQGLCFNAAPQDGDGEQRLPAAFPRPGSSSFSPCFRSSAVWDPMGALQPHRSVWQRQKLRVSAMLRCSEGSRRRGTSLAGQQRSLKQNCQSKELVSLATVGDGSVVF